MSFDELHRDRGRAESFGAIVEQYDRWRPRCPDALLDDLAAAAPPGTEVLDVGCGTGAVAGVLGKRGVAVLGVETDERMASVARGRGVAVEVAPFEKWADAGRSFGLVVCGNAWHWLEPVAAAARVAAVLRPGGAFIRYWTYDVLDAPTVEALRPAYREHAPSASLYGYVPRDQTYADPLESHAAFRDLETRTYRWERVLTAAEWIAMIATASDHQRLGPERLAALQGAVRAVIEGLGGVVRSNGETTALFGRRA